MDLRLRLFRNLILLSLPLMILMGIAARFPMDYMGGEYPMWAEEKDFVQSGGKEAETLIIGDSRAKSSIIPGELDTEGYNMAIGGATPIEMYYALNEYLENNPAPQNAIVIFAPYHFCDIDNFDQTLYFNYLTIGEVLSLEKKAFLLKDSEKVAYSGWITDLISYKLRLPGKYLAAIYDAYEAEQGKKNRKRYDKIRKDKGHTLFGEDRSNNEPSYETHHETFDRSPLVLDYYEALLTRLRDEGVKVIIEQAPLNPASFHGLYPEFKEGYKEYMEGIAQRYPDFKVVKKIPEYDEEYFGDNNHLNRQGAEKYTARIQKKYFDNK